MADGSACLASSSFFVVDVVGDAVADGLVEVAVGVFLEQTPYTPARREGDCATLLGAVEEEGDDGVAADVAGDVLLGVVGAHLFLVDVFFEDVAEHIGVDLVVIAQGAVVEMPLVGVEEGERSARRLRRGCRCPGSRARGHGRQRGRR